MMSRSNQLPNLEKLFKDDDEQDFAPLGGSNLAAIFETPYKATDIGPSPKTLQKKSNEKTIATNPNKTEVIIAKPVHAYKLQNGQYILDGKLGIALAGNPTTKTYLLILYRHKQEHVSIVSLTPEFCYTVQENNYATYYDEKNENWSILFENATACIEFAREIGISKYLLKPDKGNETIFYQNLTASNGEEGAEENHKLLVKYSIISNIVQPLRVNATSIQDTEIQITSDDNWEKSLIGANKGLKKLLILPPSKQISLGPGFPRDRDVAIEIEILEIIPPEIMKAPRELYHPSGKASLISRMAKMGQSILPKMPTSTTTDSDDTEDEVLIKSPRRLKTTLPEVAHHSRQASPAHEPPEAPFHGTNGLMQRNILPTTVATTKGTLVAASAFTPTSLPWAPTSIQQQYMTIPDGQLYPIQSAMPQATTIAADPNINVFLSENRTHNAEIRMGMSKIADNVQKLLDKFHVLEVQQAASPNNEKALETSLKMLLTLNSERIDKRDHHSDETERNSALDATFKKEQTKLKNELEETKRSLLEKINRIKFVEDEKKILETKILEMQSDIERLTSSVDARNELQKSLIKYQKVNTKLEAKNITLEAEKKLLKKTILTRQKTNAQDKTAEIKHLMNKTYQTLIGKFPENTDYTTEYIKTTIASTIRAITLQVLKEGKIEVDVNISSDAEMNESTSLPIHDSNGIKMNEEDNITLPDILAGPSDFGMDITANTQDEPPPIPPMDLDIDNDWIS